MFSIPEEKINLILFKRIYFKLNFLQLSLHPYHCHFGHDFKDDTNGSSKITKSMPKTKITLNM